MSRNTYRVVLSVGLCLLATAAIACPSCKEALGATDPERATLVRGYFWSILFMLSMPFTVLTSFVVYMYVLVRRARRAAAQAAAMPKSDVKAEQELAETGV